MFESEGHEVERNRQMKTGTDIKLLYCNMIYTIEITLRLCL